MASDSAGQTEDKDAGHRNHFRLLQEEGFSWSGREPNTLFQNRGDGTFDEVGNVLGLYLRLDSRGAAPADLDGDGDLDLVVYNRNNPIVKIYRNDFTGQGNALLVELTDTRGETMAAGARVVARCGEHRRLRQVEVGSGFLSQAPPTLHFGLGACREVDEIEVTWPDGEREVVSGLPVHHRVHIRRGEGAIELVALEPRNYNRAELAAPAGELSAVVPELTFERLDREGELRLADLGAETVVLNFWATWCTACTLEVPDLERLSGRFANRVRFVGVSLDEGVGSGEVLAFARQLGASYEQVRGEVEDQQPFSSLGGTLPGAVPLTAVLHRGTVRAVYVGQIDEEELATLLERLS